MKRLILVLLGVAIGISVSAIYATITEPNTTELEHLPEPYYTVLWENEDVRIMEHRIEIGESEPRHSHPKMLAYIMENSNVRVTEADGTVHDVELIKGEFQELSPWTHSIENVGETPLHTLLIELKSPEN